ncbi:MAG: hypothetical protein H8E40_14750 [Chloroflexi bacterium]|nr:hypothetical protein [Chloroflexota bacterium]
MTTIMTWGKQRKPDSQELRPAIKACHIKQQEKAVGEVCSTQTMSRS